MYRQFAMQFHKKQVEFINCVNMVERIKKERALRAAAGNPLIRKYVVTNQNNRRPQQFSVRDCR